jgi:hypothetical protein
VLVVYLLFASRQDLCCCDRLGLCARCDTSCCSCSSSHLARALNFARDLECVGSAGMIQSAFVLRLE